VLQEYLDKVVVARAHGHVERGSAVLRVARVHVNRRKLFEEQLQDGCVRAVARKVVQGLGQERRLGPGLALLALVLRLWQLLVVFDELGQQGCDLFGVIRIWKISEGCD
jgi:hypothetical protein